MGKIVQKIISDKSLDSFTDKELEFIAELQAAFEVIENQGVSVPENIADDHKLSRLYDETLILLMNSGHKKMVAQNVIERTLKLYEDPSLLTPENLKTACLLNMKVKDIKGQSKFVVMDRQLSELGDQKTNTAKKGHLDERTGIQRI